MVAQAQHRVIKGLRWARLLKHKPPGVIGQVHKKCKGTKADGRRFENGLVKLLEAWKTQGQLPANLVHGQWFEYEDSAGHGYCQPDILLFNKSQILLLECKLTQTDVAFQQMEELYVPVLQKIFPQKVYTVQATRTLRHNNDKLLDCIVEFFCEPQPGRFTWHVPNPEMRKLQPL